MTELRRRQTAPKASDKCAPPSQPSKQQQRSSCFTLCWISFLILLYFASVHNFIALPRLLPPKPSRPHLHSFINSPSDEASIAGGVLPFEDAIPSSFSERALACMPTVTRRSGNVEYVSNAVKSWRLATNRSSVLRRLAVFDMDVPISSAPPAWLNAVFDEFVRQGETPSWLTLLKRESDELEAPRKHTYGDSEERVRWRSKEALDYAEVLRRCAELTEGEYVIVVQDDVLFTERITEVVDWCERHMVDKVVTDEKTGRRRMKRVCSVSLFDLPGTKSGVDAHEIDASNMVGRVWKTDRIPAMEKYFQKNFDDAPVDWLADRICKSQRRKTLVMDPNPVRHRGKVSSFDQNNREGLLT